MARSMVVPFPASSTTALMALTDVGSSLVLNLNTIPTKTWNIAITSTGDVHTHTFTIAGTDINDTVISETITGGTAADPSLTTAQFKTVSSIISKTAGVPAAVNNLKAGVMDLVASTQAVAMSANTILKKGDETVLHLGSGVGYVLSFASASDLSAVTFTVTGTDAANAPLVEMVTGPNNDIVFSIGEFATITSIVPDGVVADITIGSEIYLAALQDTAADGLFVLDNTTFLNQEWLLSISSPNDLSGSIFHITGTNLAGAVAEYKTGPNNGFVNSVSHYSTVSSISVNESVLSVAVNIPDYIAPLQSVIAPADLILSQDVISFATGTSYAVSLKSASDNSAVTFTITGTNSSNAPLVEAVTGPNNETVITVGDFKTISSISPDVNATNIIAGIYGIIAATQDSVADVPDILTPIGGYPIEFYHLERTITLTSPAGVNNSGVNFTITGTDQYNTATTEVLAGPNANTVTSAHKYHTITSIVPDGEFFPMSMGTGSTGIIQWLYLNQTQNPPNTVIQVDVTGTINYSVTQTLDGQGAYVQSGGSYSYVQNITPASFAVVAALTTATTDQIYNLATAATGLQTIINSSTGGSLIFTVQQPGF
jgi:hypothetical protein